MSDLKLFHFNSAEVPELVGAAGQVEEVVTRLDQTFARANRLAS
ncbi:hypothetical protein R1521_17075 [Rhizobium brockwellii]|uniref:Uncharacterized protein n=1 Tax=Rhizobium brockwellii TaxID=3019932 RepID=A0ABU3YMS7_9HYPH|nr:hypothetical protein [Rhizobium brockwellii]MDV4180214.1 hypothetical protein [Rhizobium brockwellii]MDV4187136.1 hypothetical protein [Rhizobium brockwellii]